MRRPEYKHIIEKLSVDYFETKTLLLKDKKEIITKFETEAIYYEKLSPANKYLIAREYYQKFMFFSDSNLIIKLNQFIGVPVVNTNNMIDFSFIENEIEKFKNEEIYFQYQILLTYFDCVFLQRCDINAFREIKSPASLDINSINKYTRKLRENKEKNLDFIDNFVKSCFDSMKKDFIEKGIFESIITLPLCKILHDSLSDNYRIANYYLKMIMEFIIKSNHAMEVKTNKNKIYRGFKNILYSVFPDNEFYGILREDKFYKVFATRQYEYDYDYKKYYLSKAKDLFGQRIR